MNYTLPDKLEFDGSLHDVRNKGDYRVVLDTIAALLDPELNSEEKSEAALTIFYDDISKISDVEAALKQMMWFIALGKKEEKNEGPKLMDWEQDFDIIVPSINRVVGRDVRSVDYMHWWTFIGAYYEIGNSMFSTVISIRNKHAKGKKLLDYERDFERENPEICRLKSRISDNEQEYIDMILNGGDINGK